MNFQTSIIKEAAIDGCECRLVGVIQQQLSEIDKHFNGIFDVDILASLLGLSKEISASNIKASLKSNYDHIFWRTIKETPYLTSRYGEIMRVVFDNHSTRSVLTLTNLNAFFSHINVDAWLQSWDKESLNSFEFINGITTGSSLYSSVDQTDIGYHFVGFLTGETEDYFLSEFSLNGMAIYLRELLRNCFTKSGCCGSAESLERILKKRPDCIPITNDIVNNMIRKMDINHCKHSFFDEEFYTSAVSFVRSGGKHTLLYPIKLTRLATGTIEDLINFINKTKSDPRIIINLLCNIHQLTPYDLLSDPNINSNGKRHCLQLLAS